MPDRSPEGVTVPCVDCGDSAVGSRPCGFCGIPRHGPDTYCTQPTSHHPFKAPEGVTGDTLPASEPLTSWAVVREGTKWRVSHVGVKGGLTSLGGGDRREDAQAVLDGLIANGTCRECGEVGLYAGYGEPFKSRILNGQVCFPCLFWLDVLERADRPDIVRVDGHQYTIAPDEPSHFGGFRGFGGREFRIAFDDGRRVVSHNLWSQGDIPAHFRDRMPNNAIFEAQTGSTQGRSTPADAGTEVRDA